MRTTKGAARTGPRTACSRRRRDSSAAVAGCCAPLRRTWSAPACYAYRDRRNRKRDFRRLWIIRVNAAVRAHGLRYSEFIAGLQEGQDRIGPQGSGRLGRGRSRKGSRRS